MTLIDKRLWVLLVLIVWCTAIVMLGNEPAVAAQTPPGVEVRLIQNDPGRIVLKLDLSSYETRLQRVETGTFAHLSIPGLGLTGEVGRPQLPVEGVLIGIPAGAQPSLKVLDDQSRRDTLAQHPIPVARLRMEMDATHPTPRNAGRSFVPDAATYSANRLYPSSAARLGRVGTWRSQRYVSVEFFPLQYNPVGKQLLFHQSLRVEVSLSYPGGTGAAALGQVVDEGAYESVLKSSLLNYDTSKSWRTASLPAPRAGASRAADYAGGPWYKVEVNADGMYKIACDRLPAGIDANTLRLFKEDKQLGTKRELAISVLGDWTTCNAADDYIEFFGQAANTKYTDTNIYWLTYGDRPDLGTVQRMANREGGGAGDLQTAFTDTLHVETNSWYIPLAPAVEGFDHWFWNFMAGGLGIPSKNHPFQLERFVASPYSATLQIDLVGVNKGSHHTLIKVNGTTIDNATWSGRVERKTTIPFNHSLLHAGSNTITVVEPDVGDRADPDIPVDYILSNYFDLSYRASYTALGDVLRFRQPVMGASRYQICNYTSADLRVFDITDPFAVARFDPATFTITSPCSYSLGFGDTLSDGPHEYLALATSQYKTPQSISLDTPSNWRTSANGADYIIIAPHDFVDEAQVLADFRRPQMPRDPLVIDVQDIYDEFNDGVLDPQAIRDFLYYAYVSWQRPAPSYVVLVGDGTYDPKGYCAPQPCPGGEDTPDHSTLIPPFLRMVDPWTGEVPSDNRFVSFHDQDSAANPLPDMSIGRLPARDEAEVTAMVTKIKYYEQYPPGSDWKYHVAFIADNPFDPCGTIGGAGDFWSYSDAVALNPAYIPYPFATNRIYHNPCTNVTSKPYTTVDQTKSAIRAAINSGNVFVSYTGHGAHSAWSNSHVFTADDVPNLSNAGKYPVMLEMACNTGDFANPNTVWQGLAETLVRADHKGALASWAAVGQGITAGHDLLEKGFLNAIMWYGLRELGPATVAGNAHLWANGAQYYGDLVDTFILIGDPASRLSLPRFDQTFLPTIRR